MRSRVEAPIMEKNAMYDYEVEEDLRCVARAKAVEGDAKRMEKVKKLAKQKLDEFKGEKEAIQKKIDLGEQK